MHHKWLTLVFISLLASGCSWFTWLPWVDDPEGPDPMEPAKLVKFDAEIRVKRLWKVSIGEGLGKKYLRLNPVILADRIFAADGYGVVEARNRFDGKRIWRARVGELEGGFFSSLNFFDRKDPSFVSGGVGAGAGFVLVGTTSGTVVALSAADGAEVWRTFVGSEVLARPSVGDDAVFVQTIDGRLVALETKDGSVRWSFDNQVPVLTLRGTSAPVYDDGVVYGGFANGMVSAVKTDTGEPVWEQRIMLPEGRSELDRMVDVDGSPMLSGSLVYAVAYHGMLKAMRRSDGSPIWQRKHSSFLDLSEGYGQIYVVDETDLIIAIDQQNAEETWSQANLYRRKLTSPVAFSNYLIVGDDEGYLHVLAQSDGRFLGRRKLDSDGLRSAMVVGDGKTLYVLGNSGSLQAIEIEVR
ncbi:MAG: outer membrane protein assembly factor BamB [Gammaproteobacteria bacterium]|nr:outer membrane protein assembly factor BamB [Gammaproteobacteria bacterium]